MCTNNIAVGQPQRDTGLKWNSLNWSLSSNSRKTQKCYWCINIEKPETRLQLLHCSWLSFSRIATGTMPLSCCILKPRMSWRERSEVSDNRWPKDGRTQIGYDRAKKERNGFRDFTFLSPRLSFARDVTFRSIESQLNTYALFRQRGKTTFSNLPPLSKIPRYNVRGFSEISY